MHVTPGSNTAVEERPEPYEPFVKLQNVKYKYLKELRRNNIGITYVYQSENDVS